MPPVSSPRYLVRHAEVGQRDAGRVEDHVAEDAGEEVALGVPVAPDRRVVGKHQLRTPAASGGSTTTG